MIHYTVRNEINSRKRWGRSYQTLWYRGALITHKVMRIPFPHVGEIDENCSSVYCSMSLSGCTVTTGT
jgi:hypothetical protein